mgnify:CR=1 FL=1
MVNLSETACKFHCNRIENYVKVYLDDLKFLKKVKAEAIRYNYEYKIYVKITIDESLYIMSLLESNPTTIDWIKEYIKDIEGERYIFEVGFDVEME